MMKKLKELSANFFKHCEPSRVEASDRSIEGEFELRDFGRLNFGNSQPLRRMVGLPCRHKSTDV